MEKREKIFLSSDERCQTYLNHKSIVLTTICSLSPHHIYINCARTTSTTYNDDINLQHHRFSCFNKFVVVILSLSTLNWNISHKGTTRHGRGGGFGGETKVDEKKRMNFILSGCFYFRFFFCFHPPFDGFFLFAFFIAVYTLMCTSHIHARTSLQVSSSFLMALCFLIHIFFL